MKNTILRYATLAFSCTTLSMAGTTEEYSGSSVDDHNPWNVEYTYMHMVADGAAGYFNYFGQEHESAFRLSLAYQPNANGIGYRVSWTEFEGTHVPASGEHGPTFEDLQIVAFKDYVYGGFDVEYSLGLRYTDVFEPFGGGTDVSWQGLGPVAGVSAEYGLSHGFSLYGDVAYSYMFGDSKTVGNRVGDDKFFQHYGFGVKYDFELLGVTDLYLKTGYELQKYSEIGWWASDVDISGWTLTLGYSF